VSDLLQWPIRSKPNSDEEFKENMNAEYRRHSRKMIEEKEANYKKHCNTKQNLNDKFKKESHVISFYEPTETQLTEHKKSGSGLLNSIWKEWFI